jgi:hypothetical protein
MPGGAPARDRHRRAQPQRRPAPRPPRARQHRRMALTQESGAAAPDQGKEPPVTGRRQAGAGELTLATVQAVYRAWQALPTAEQVNDRGVGGIYGYEASGSSFVSARPSPKRAGSWSAVKTLMSLTTITTVGGWGRPRSGRRPRALRALLTAATAEMMVKASSTCTTSRRSPPFLTSTLTSHRGVATCVTPACERRGAVCAALQVHFPCSAA